MSQADQAKLAEAREMRRQKREDEQKRLKQAKSPQQIERSKTHRERGIGHPNAEEHNRKKKGGDGSSRW